MPVFLNQGVKQLDNFHRIFGIDTDTKAVVKVKNCEIAVVIFCRIVIYERKTYVGAFNFALGSQRILSSVEVPVLVEHPQNGTAGQLRHILVIVLYKGLFIDQTFLVDFIQLLVILLGIIFVCKNFSYAVLYNYTAIVWMTDQMLWRIEQTPVFPVVVQNFESDSRTAIDFWIFRFILLNQVKVLVQCLDLRIIEFFEDCFLNPECWSGIP
ncbi:hypothetical protein D3C75_825860 [compost metagenome]